MGDIHHEVYLMNIQVEANEYKECPTNAESVHQLCTERASEKGSNSVVPRLAKGREKYRTKAPYSQQYRYKNGADRVMHFGKPFLCTF